MGPARPPGAGCPAPVAVAFRGCGGGFASPRPLRASTAHSVGPRRVACCDLHRSNSLRRYGNINPSSIGYAFRPGLRSRLTPGGRTCPGKPWDSGGRDFHPPFRYSCPHNRFQEVHGRFPFRFVPSWNAPLPSRHKGAVRGVGIPFDSRSFSARDHSTSQLLRTV